MASAQRNPKDLRKMIAETKQDMDDLHLALGNLRVLSKDERTDAALLRSRINEQSSLIGILKQRADEMLLRCQVLGQINEEMEEKRENVQAQLEKERERSSQLEQRFMDLAANHQQLIIFKDEYKRKNMELMSENEQLREENQRQFCKRLQEKEDIILMQTKRLKDIAQQHTNLEAEYKAKTIKHQTKIKELCSMSQTKEASLQDELHTAQKQLKDAMATCTELDLQLIQTRENHRSKESQLQEKLESLVKEKDELLDLSMQRGKIIQDKQEEIELLKNKRQEEVVARLAAEDRFAKETAEVNADVKVLHLQQALGISEQTCSDLRKDFEAYIKHSSDLLEKEKQLNAKLRHMIG